MVAPGIDRGKPLHHRSFAAADFEDSSWVRDPESQATGKIVQVDENSLISFRDLSLIGSKQTSD